MNRTLTRSWSGFAPVPLAALAGLILFSPGCQADCVRRCQLDPVEQDLNRWKSQRAALAEQRRELMQRVREFDDKVFVNQKAALDLLRADLAKRCADFVKRLRAVKVGTAAVHRAHRLELDGFAKLAESYSILQSAFETENASGIRRGLKTRQRALRLIRGAEVARQKLERKYWRKKR